MGLEFKLIDTGMECPECSNYYASKSSLAKHRLLKHPTAEERLRPYKCSDCGKKFRTDNGRKQHARLHYRREFREEESIVEEYYDWNSGERNRETAFCMYCYEGDFRGIKEVLDHMRECRLANNDD